MRLQLSVPIITNILIVSTKAEQVNVTITDFLWPQIRSSIANYLVDTENYDIETAYQEVFTRVPAEGSCWCFEEKKRVSRGKPQDLYDAACKKYHGCLKCGFYKLEQEFQEYATGANLTIDMVEVASFDSTSSGLSEIISGNNLLNHDSLNNRLSVYNWICDENQDIASVSVCKGFQQLQNDMIRVVIDEMRENLPSGYGATCDRPESDCPECIGEGQDPDHVINKYGQKRGPIDGCCGTSPTWKTFAQLEGEQACCGHNVYNKLTYECCDEENGVVNPLGCCEVGSCTTVVTTTTTTASTATPETTTSPTPATTTSPTPAPTTITNPQPAIHPCLDSSITVCQNNGNCVYLTETTYHCECTEFFSGTNCQINHSPCQWSSENPCLNQGTCTGTTSLNTCNCEHTGFQGSNCEIERTTIEINCNINLSQDLTIEFASCKNGVSEISPICNLAGVGEVFDTCECLEKNYGGVDCNTNISPCQVTGTNPCQNSGECFGENGNGAYTCICSEGFTGVNCESEIEETPCETSNECLNGGVCVNAFEVVNNGSDDDFSVTIGFVATTTCDCSATEFTGEFCETEKTPCDSNPCENNGACNVVEDADADNGLSYSCDCAFEFTGVVCETPIPCLTQTNLCLNSGVCENSEDYTSHTCACRMFYGVPDC